MRRLFFALTLAACTTSKTETVRRGGPGTEDSGGGGGGTGGGGSGGADSASDGPCGQGMVVVDDTFCIDAYEGTLQEQGDDGSWSDASPYETVEDRVVRAVSQAGVDPQGYISGDEAEEACERAGKRLCTSDEWLAACQGPNEYTWPYGDSYDSTACNDTYEGGHPVMDYFDSDDVWDMEHMNDPGINQQDNTVSETGSYAGCVSVWGAFDMHGNLHEWVADADGTFRGGFYADAEINGEGCLYRTTAHERSYHDYSTGFRCCGELE